MRVLFFKIFVALYLLVISVSLSAQIITTEPALPVSGQAVTIYFDATKGAAGLKNFTGDVYAHTGVLTNNSSGSADWKYVKTNWGINTPETKMTRISDNLYSLEITPNIRNYYGVPTGETVTHMAFVFRSADSSKEGKDDGGTDIFAQVFDEGLSVSIIIPEKNRIINPGEEIIIETASSLESTLSLFENGALIKTTNGTTLTYIFKPTFAGDYWIRISALSGLDTVSDSVFIHALHPQVEEQVPPGLSDGIHYIGNQTVQLVLYTPGKEHVFAIGDFNSWTPRSDARMVKDGHRFWITLNNLVPGAEYAFQYLIDGSLTIADPYSQKIIDPVNDKWIPEETYPEIKPYPWELTSGIAGILQTAQAEYPWKIPSFTPPKSEDLVIYELLVRDFIKAHDWQTLIDKLDYLTGLGINAIELMPVNEFEGNESWGYNPSFYFAPDKYYGPADDLKAFIDACHERDVAVIIDMVLNHSYGQSPLVQLYYENSTGKVSSDNPWYNVESPNPVFSWGYDFDHESQDTKDFVDRVTGYWMEEFHVDGYRFDFTKGFTNTPGDGGAYDASRIDILKRMADKIWATNENAYVILEHLADNSEEKELSDYGMMLWGNLNYNYNEAAMGYHDGDKSDFSRISYKSRGWIDPHLVGYMESHDEERLMYKNVTHGNWLGDYNIRNLNTALERMELAGAFFFTVPGPKMIWQFGELGFDFSIDYDCRVCNKPIRWDYYENSMRKKLYQVWSALIDIKIREPAFESNDFTLFVSGVSKRIEINDPDMDIRIIGNFDTTEQSSDPSFSGTGWWYDFFNGDSVDVTDVHGLMPLAPGAFRIYTTRKLSKPEITAGMLEYAEIRDDFWVYPNPVSDMLFFDPVTDIAQITISNLVGKVMMKIDLLKMQDCFDVSSLAEGLYIINKRIGNHPPLHAKIYKK